MGKFNKENLFKIKIFTEEGKSAREIATILGETIGNIEYYRRKYKWYSKHIPGKSYQNLDQIKKYVLDDDLTDREIAEKLQCCEETIRKCRIKYNIQRPNKRLSQEINISNEELEILIGTLLGDSSLTARSKYSATFSCQHSLQQKEYIDHLYQKLPSLQLSITYRKSPSSIGIVSKCSPTLLRLYEQFYKNKIKIIPRNLIEKYFTIQSLSYLFMDDGSARKGARRKTKNNTRHIRGFEIATCSFTHDDLEWFCNFLNKKFDLNFKILSHYNKVYDKSYEVLSLGSNEVQKFIKLVSPYIINSLKYKIQED